VKQKCPVVWDSTQFFYLLILNDWLKKLNVRGEFIHGGDTFFAGAHRRPDVAFHSTEQILAGKRKELIVPQLVIEVISSNDQMKIVHKKRKDYRAANVPVIWRVFPDLEEVHVYRGKQMLVCTGEDICSAEPVIKGFLILAKELFG
jgi:Uma2 family endonuclease